MTTATRSTSTETDTQSAQSSVEGTQCFNVIGGNCQAMKECCETIKAKMAPCPGVDTTNEWDTLEQCLEQCLEASQAGAQTFGIPYAPLPAVAMRGV